ncbi:uncharacterized protein [Antennarius striatus]|uniref:uncharacterized protein n=1 Tax=Antennarius striatus TaxID=241820 RepID=UPI0035B42ED4
MKPISYQNMPSSVNGGHPVLDHLSSTSSLMRCQKCGYACADAAVFKKHMLEHMGTRFYCFYCNNISSSEAELNTHLKQHTAKYPFKCPHCGQGYMRRLCLVKHIDRLHSKAGSYGPLKAGDPKTPHVPVSSALPSVPAADPTALRPLVRVSLPTSSASAFRMAKDEQRGKPLDANASNLNRGNGEFLSPLNGLIQHNRALTVSLPDEVSIPAGCLVELVEVKTVNGTKELKLRLVSQQENGSVIKDTRTTVHQNIAPGKQLSSTLNNPNTVKSPSMGLCTVNRTQVETKTVNVDRPVVVPVNISKNIPHNVSPDKSLLKRTSQEIINLECNTVIPNKVPKVINLVREKNSGIRVTQREPVNHNAVPPTLAAIRVPTKLSSTLPPENIGIGVTQRTMDERKSSIPELSKSIPRRVSDMKSIPRDTSVAVKREPGEIHIKNSTASSSVLLPAAGHVKTPSISLCKDNFRNKCFSLSRNLNGPSFTKPSKMSVWNQDVRPIDRAGEVDVPEPEGFPVISSVFSLSQQHDDVQGSIQPLVMALRGIVMDKSSSPVNTSCQDQIKIKTTTEPTMETLTSGHCAMMVAKDEAFARNLSMTGQTTEPVKVEDCCKGVQHPPALTLSHTHVKEEKNNASAHDEKDCSGITDSKASKEEKPGSETAECVDGSGISEDPLQLTEKSENDISSKFLTVSGISEEPLQLTEKSENDISSKFLTVSGISEEPLQLTEKSEREVSSKFLMASGISEDPVQLTKKSENDVSSKFLTVSGISKVPLQATEKSENDISSKFLTVSLKRVQVGVWKKNKKGVKLRISKYKTQVPMGSLSDCAVIYPMPLKEDQPVKRPGPNQPVVVLNHPKPRGSSQGIRTDTLVNAEAPQVVPKCQILKMRLSKVMGQKYEVMGCTVGVFP